MPDSFTPNYYMAIARNVISSSFGGEDKILLLFQIIHWRTTIVRNRSPFINKVEGVDNKK